MTSSTDAEPLRDPWMVAAFEGWNDAADAASGVVDHLIEEWDAELLVELDPEDFYDFQVHRPQVQSSDDGERQIVWPAPQIFVARPARLERDVLLLRAPEPNFRWKAFCSTVIGVAQLAGVTELVTLGALLADSPHTRPVPVTGSTVKLKLPKLARGKWTVTVSYSGDATYAAATGTSTVKVKARGKKK